MTTIKVKGMSCQHCVNAVTKALDSVDGITDVRVVLKRARLPLRKHNRSPPKSSAKP